MRLSSIKGIIYITRLIINWIVFVLLWRGGHCRIYTGVAGGGLISSLCFIHPPPPKPEYRTPKGDKIKNSFYNYINYFHVSPIKVTLIHTKYYLI